MIPVNERVEGVVAKWSDKGFGFINLNDGRRAYVHCSEIQGRELQCQLDIGETVNCMVVQDPTNPGKWQARSLQRGGLAEDGVVTEWREDGGFGFITLDDGRRAYVHHSCFGGGNLELGQRLMVCTKPDSRDPQKLCVSEIRCDDGKVANAPPDILATVLEWEPKGYGFLYTEDGRKVYVHHSAFGQGDLTPGEQVRCSVVPDRRNPRKFMADRVTRLEGAGLALGDLGDGSGSSLQMMGHAEVGDGIWMPAKVHVWYEEKGYGFVELQDGRRVYVHHSVFGHGSLLDGGDCETVVAPDRLNPDKWRAIQVRGAAVVPSVIRQQAEQRQVERELAGYPSLKRQRHF